MQQVHLILSFDHELSLGQVLTTYEDNLFRPTARILETADSCGVPVSLFTDVLSAIKFREWNVNEYVAAYEQQLREALRRGHEVQLHLHPHWLEAKLEGRGFGRPRRYSLHEFRDDPYPRNIRGIVEQGVSYLNEVCGTEQSGHRCCAYRAGGLNLIESTGEILTALWDHGIRIDSSVAKDFRFQWHLSSVDFSGMPRAANWYAPLSGPIGGTAREGMFEVPIVTSRRRAFGSAAAILKRMARRNDRPPRSGLPMYHGGAGLLSKLRRQLQTSAWLLSFDLHFFSGSELVKMLDSYVARHAADPVIYAATISHPKDMGEGNVVLMQEFIERARDRYGDRLTFGKFGDLPI